MTGGLPTGESPALGGGESLQFLNWYCGANVEAVRAVVRDPSGNEQPQTLTPGDRRGSCQALSALLESTGLASGSYVYELIPGEVAPVTRSFDVR